MNNILYLKGTFQQKKNSSKPNTPLIPKYTSVSSSHLHALSEQLTKILQYWKKDDLINGALISVHYKQIVAKSNRICILFSNGAKQASSDSIRGAKFEWETSANNSLIPKHVFTHYISLNVLQKSIQLLENAAQIIDKGYNGCINYLDCQQIKSMRKAFPYRETLAYTTFLRVIFDGYHVERFGIDKVSADNCEESIVTIFKTDIPSKRLLAKLGINIIDDRILDDTTFRLRPDEFKLLVNQAPYLISMSVVDLSELSKDDIDTNEKKLISPIISIPSPTQEPIVGVIDTQFNEHVYFHEWVDYQNMLPDDIPLEPKDFEHGTAVTSIIVDGPRGNPRLEDGCGHFRVKHFGVATHKAFSSFSILRQIKNIVASNPEIKVWNLSLGSFLEIKKDFISPEASILDQVQNEFDVIFIIAGTNTPFNFNSHPMKIGAPADSLNSIVVNSVNFNNQPASYTRTGPVLSFFYKPDVSYYGGDGPSINDKIAVCINENGASYVSGTSFAAPWITRKIAYLIYNMGLSREVAKALLIDSAAGWQSKDDCSFSTGYGIVPIHISDILHSTDSEIRFIIAGTAKSYETYSYNLPIPMQNNAYPFYARATLVYFPQCDRNQGVDYTDTELDIHFGRIKIEKGKICVIDIKKNKQSEEGLHVIYEKDARKNYRKWDNVKYVCEKIGSRAIPRTNYNDFWGIKIIKKERLSNHQHPNLNFGLIVTLKEMNNINRIDDFIQLCMARGWLVNQLDVQNRLDIYAKAEEEILWQK